MIQGRVKAFVSLFSFFFSSFFLLLLFFGRHEGLIWAIYHPSVAFTKYALPSWIALSDRLTLLSLLFWIFRILFGRNFTWRWVRTLALSFSLFCAPTQPTHTFFCLQGRDIRCKHVPGGRSNLVLGTRLEEGFLLAFALRQVGLWDH